MSDPIRVAALMPPLPDIAPVLSGAGLLLRPWTADDAAGVLEIADDPISRRFSPSLRNVFTLAQAEAWIETRQQRGTNWAVTDDVSGELLGRVGLHHIDLDDRAAEIGYGLKASARGKGVASRAVRVAVDFGFGELGLARICLEHALDNTASCRVARATGFVPEGIKRSAIACGDGTYDDAHLHARLPADPPRVTSALPSVEPTEIAAGPYQLCVPNPGLDAEAIVVACADPLIALYNTGPDSVEDAYAWCRGRADWSDGTHASWLVKDTSGALLGAVSIFQMNERSLGGQLGYWVAAPARGRGVGTAAAKAAARFGFEAFGLARLELFHAVDNEASCRLATSAGFVLEGTHRQSYRYGDGVLRDEHSHARLATD